MEYGHEKIYTLYELNGLVREGIRRALPDEYWVKAELSEVREVRGHCYMWLVEKDQTGNTPVASASAKCWRSTWSRVRVFFERETGQTLRAGMEVLVRVSAQFHESYGFSWIVSDIDPAYTLGDMARKRQLIVAKLKAEGVFDLNRQLHISPFVKHVAVITSETAAGYGDFRRQLEENGYGFVFHAVLFPAVMQGETVERSVIAALDRINASAEAFDCVMIIRGGGATSDMSGFDSLALAENVAQFPLPIITGIGHDRDECVLDMVANTRVKTPTAAADLLVGIVKGTADKIDTCAAAITTATTNRMRQESLRLNSIATKLPLLFATMKTKQSVRIDDLWKRIYNAVNRRLTDERHALDMLGQRLQALDPNILLKRGYSITLHEGKTVRDPAALCAGDVIVTRVEKGQIKSEVM